MCKISGESVKHLVFYCSVAISLAIGVFIIWHILGYAEDLIIQMLGCWQARFDHH